MVIDLSVESASCLEGILKEAWHRLDMDISGMEDSNPRKNELQSLQVEVHNLLCKLEKL